MQNRLGYETFADVVMFYVDVSGFNNDGICNWTCIIDW